MDSTGDSKSVNENDEWPFDDAAFNALEEESARGGGSMSGQIRRRDDTRRMRRKRRMRAGRRGAGDEGKERDG